MHTPWAGYANGTGTRHRLDDFRARVLPILDPITNVLVTDGFISSALCWLARDFALEMYAGEPKVLSTLCYELCLAHVQ